MKLPVRFGLIGAGGYGLHHLDALKALEEAGAAKLVAVADPDAGHLGQLRERFELEEVSFYEDHHEMLSGEPEIDAVTIAAPIPFHYEMTRACLERDLFVYLEKPPAPLLHQLDELVEMDADCRVGVGFQLIGAIWVQQLKRWIKEGRLGEIQEIRTCACWPRPDSYYGRAGWVGRMTHEGQPTFDGPATNAMAHLIHNIMYLGANGSGAFDEPAEIQAELYRARPIESYDIAGLRGHLCSGVRFFAFLAHASRQNMPYRMEVAGTKGWARVSQDGNRLESSNLGPVECAETLAGLMVKSYSAFIEYIAGKKSRPLTSLKDARGYVLATNAMLLSSGGIHTIGEDWVERNGQTGDGFYEVKNLCTTMDDAFHHQHLPSEMGMPWAVKTCPLAIGNFGRNEAAMIDRFFRPNTLTPTPAGDGSIQGPFNPGLRAEERVRL